MIVKHSLAIRGHQTSISIEDPFWQRLRIVAVERDMALAALVAEIDERRDPVTNLSSAIRLFVLADALGRIAA